MQTKRLSLLSILLVLILCLAACGSSEPTETNDDSSATDTPVAEGVILSIKVPGAEESKDYTLEDIENLETVTHKYSGRNKENNNERQVREYTGVELKTLFESAGYEAKDTDILLIKASDGYTSEFVLGEKYGLLYYTDENTTKGKVVPPILAIINEGDAMGNDTTYSAKDGSPLRLVYGQTDYDSAETKDFNMQGWTSYVCEIEVTESE